ncbi:uncharacterized protein [Bombus fervidus]|uniref:uncharacterized protein n=1 Tax=Bombus fervidus TaxID=203811 RepID=UPI003D1887B1
MSGAAQVTNVSSAGHLQRITPIVQSVPHLNTAISSHACICTTGCSTQRCGCVKGGIQCGQSCKCRSYGCQNQRGRSSSQQMSVAAQVRNVSTAGHLLRFTPIVQNVRYFHTAISSHACTCRTGCSTRRCGCVNRGIRCGGQCACAYYGCSN